MRKKDEYSSNQPLYGTIAKEKFKYYSTAGTKGESKVYLNEVLVDKMMNEVFFSKLQFTDEELTLIKRFVEEKLKGLGLLKEKFQVSSNERLKELEKEKDKLYRDYKEEESKIVKKMLSKELEEIEVKIEELSSAIEALEQAKKTLPEIVEEEEEKIEEWWKVLASFNDGTFLQLDAVRQTKVLPTIFKYVILNKERVVDFKLQPFFDVLWKKRDN